jgi:hypothetical protein|tara:strand:- start:15836 stop:16036 length:201 start_codon:yes stop_codon:yes gene_type:complete
MKISEIIVNESMGGMTSAGSVATVVKPLTSDIQRVVQRPKKPKKIGGKKKPGPKTETKTTSTIIRR